MADLRIAVIGVGLIGELHARIFAADPRCTLVAVCDTDRARRCRCRRDQQPRL